jgi:hypothetical protein
MWVLRCEFVAFGEIFDCGDVAEVVLNMKAADVVAFERNDMVGVFARFTGGVDRRDGI